MSKLNKYMLNLENDQSDIQGEVDVPEITEADRIEDKETLENVIEAKEELEEVLTDYDNAEATAEEVAEKIEEAKAVLEEAEKAEGDTPVVDPAVVTVAQESLKRFYKDLGLEAPVELSTEDIHLNSYQTYKGIYANLEGLQLSLEEAKLNIFKAIVEKVKNFFRAIREFFISNETFIKEAKAKLATIKEFEPGVYSVKGAGNWVDTYVKTFDINSFKSMVANINIMLANLKAGAEDLNTGFKPVNIPNKDLAARLKDTLDVINAELNKNKKPNASILGYYPGNNSILTGLIVKPGFNFSPLKTVIRLAAKKMGVELDLKSTMIELTLASKDTDLPLTKDTAMKIFANYNALGAEFNKIEALLGFLEIEILGGSNTIKGTIGNVTRAREIANTIYDISNGTYYVFGHHMRKYTKELLKKAKK